MDNNVGAKINTSPTGFVERYVNGKKVRLYHGKRFTGINIKSLRLAGMKHHEAVGLGRTIAESGQATGDPAYPGAVR